MKPTITYVPGVCNIGPEEISRRKTVGWVGLFITVLLVVVLLLTRVNPWWRLFAFFPAAMSAIGFIQAHFHFCTNFAQRGVFNLGPVGTTKSITDETSHAKDRTTGNKITAYSLAIALVVAIVAVLA